MPEDVNDKNRFLFSGYDTKLKKKVYGRYPWFCDNLNNNKHFLNLKDFWGKVYTGQIVNPEQEEIL